RQAPRERRRAALLVLNLVAGFQVLGTLMAVGVMMLPAVAARCWARTLPGILLLAAGMGALCAWLGLSLSWAISLPAGPANAISIPITGWLAKRVG
ncbi:hypothetical protein FK514_28370, partial [Klebsiella pneumoniae]|uniref:metal ABC transporter permease n=1 Tax=Klebsiella pneumoniae TaxID=573 RepID=UPI00210D8FD6